MWLAGKRSQEWIMLWVLGLFALCSVHGAGSGKVESGGDVAAGRGEVPWEKWSFSLPLPQDSCCKGAHLEQNGPSVCPPHSLGVLLDTHLPQLQNSQIKPMWDPKVCQIRRCSLQILVCKSRVLMLPYLIRVLQKWICFLPWDESTRKEILAF